MDGRLTGRRGIGFALAALLVGVVILGAAQIAAADARAASAPLSDAQNCVTTLTALPSLPGDGFGQAVAVDGATALVGAANRVPASPPRSDAAVLTDSVAAAGEAFVFTKSASGWSVPTTLTDPNVDPQDGFGFSAALSGDTAVVGTPFLFSGQGAVCVYTRSGGAWSNPVTFTAPNPADWSDFGLSVAISGDTMIVGAPDVTVDGVPWAGAAYVFTRTGGAWSVPVTLTAPSPAFALFGSAVDISGDNVVVGAPGQDNWAGAAYGFSRSGGTWSAGSALTTPTLVSGDTFGAAVAIQGGTALVGASGRLAAGSPKRPAVTAQGPGSSGAAYAYDVSGGVFGQPVKLTAPVPTIGDGFGQSVDVWGGTALVGGGGQIPVPAPSRVVQIGGEQSYAYLFGHDAAGWSAPVTITAFDGNLGYGFGSSVSIAQDSALVGAPGVMRFFAPATASRQFPINPTPGSAFVFDLMEPSPPHPFTATPGNGKITLTWSDPTTDYAATKIFRSTGGYASSAALVHQSASIRAAVVQTQIFDGSGTSFTSSPLVNGTTYYFTAFTRDPEGRWSAAAHASAKAGIQSGSDSVKVTQFSVTQPSPGSPFVVTGALSPKHLVPVTLTLYFCHLDDGVWEHYNVHPKVKLKAGVTRWSVRVKLPESGRWCVRAYHKDPWNRGIWSNRKFFNVTWDRW